MSSGELILCTPRNRLPQAWLPVAGYLGLAEEELFRVLDRIEPCWPDRLAAETDETLKQWIPYLLVENEQGQLAAYPRQGQETRLHGLFSLGVGGHVNLADAGEAAARPGFWRAALWNGARRELAEEFPGATIGETRFLGLINEERTAVGRVHLGAVFHHRTRCAGTSLGAELTGLRWVTPADLDGPLWPLAKFEIWSRLAFELFRQQIPGSGHPLKPPGIG